MPLGPGKYDDLCTEARKKAEAKGVILIVIGGKDGEGFACQMGLPEILRIPAVLRHIADEIEASLKAGKV